MKAKILNIVLISVLLIFIGCKKTKFELEQRGNLLYDVLYVPFKGLYLADFKNDNVFFIKGVALDVYEYGRNIEIIEDLKGNFVDTSLIYVRNGGDFRDALINYHKNDTLIMLFEKTYKDDYVTLIGHSVLKLSNSYVSGYINISCSPDPRRETEIETMLWEDLQQELQKVGI